MRFVSDEDARDFMFIIAHGLLRSVARKHATQWIKKQFMRARKPHWRTLGGWKAVFEREHPGDYLHRSEMAEAFERNGIRVEGSTVYVKEKRCSNESARAAKSSTPAMRLARSVKIATRQSPKT